MMKNGANLEPMRRNSSPVRSIAMVVRTFDALAVTPDEIRALRMPIAVIVGTADVPKERVAGFMGLQPDMKVVLIEGGTHASTTKTPEFVPAVRTFIAEHRAAANRSEP